MLDNDNDDLMLVLAAINFGEVWRRQQRRLQQRRLRQRRLAVVAVVAAAVVAVAVVAAVVAVSACIPWFFAVAIFLLSLSLFACLLSDFALRCCLVNCG